MGLFENLFGKKNDDVVNLYEVVVAMLEDHPDESVLRHAKRIIKGRFDNLCGQPDSYISLFFTLNHYYGISERNMAIVASNIKLLAKNLVLEADDRDPYEAKALSEKLFAKWPEALQVALVSAKEEDNERNLVFLACANLFGWCEEADDVTAATYVEKLGALESLKEPKVYEWLKAQIRA